MNTVDRRTILASGALALAGAAAPSVPAAAQAGPKPIFFVPAATIPIVGEEGVFPVRRIYCIGRNYAAHAHATYDSTRALKVLEHDCAFFDVISRCLKE